MTKQLPLETLIQIFENLKIESTLHKREEQPDHDTLFKCLTVNSLWCRAAVKILWENPSSTDMIFGKIGLEKSRKRKILQWLGTICQHIPRIDQNEMLTLQSRLSCHITDLPLPRPLFNYLRFIRYFDVECFRRMIEIVVGYEGQRLFETYFYKLIIRHTALRYLSPGDSPLYANISLLAGVQSCFANITEISTWTDYPPQTFLALSKTCRNIQKMFIIIGGTDNNQLAELIRVQRHLKHVVFRGTPKFSSYLLNLERALMSQASNLIELEIDMNIISPLCISALSNVQVIRQHWEQFSSRKKPAFDKLWELASFPNLKEIEIDCIAEQTLVKIIKTTRGHLQKLKIATLIRSKEIVNGKTLIPLLCNFCPQLKLVTLAIGDDDFDLLKALLDSCTELEVLVLYGTGVAKQHPKIRDATGCDGQRLFNLLAKSAPKDFCEIILLNSWVYMEDDFKNFMHNWRGRKPLYFSIRRYDDLLQDGVIKQYKEEGMLKFKRLSYLETQFETW